MTHTRVSYALRTTHEEEGLFGSFRFVSPLFPASFLADDCWRTFVSFGVLGHRGRATGGLVGWLARCFVGFPRPRSPDLADHCTTCTRVRAYRYAAVNHEGKGEERGEKRGRGSQSVREEGEKRRG